MWSTILEVLLLVTMMTISWPYQAMPTWGHNAVTMPQLLDQELQRATAHRLVLKAPLSSTRLYSSSKSSSPPTANRRHNSRSNHRNIHPSDRVKQAKSEGN